MILMLEKGRFWEGPNLIDDFSEFNEHCEVNGTSMKANNCGRIEVLRNLSKHLGLQESLTTCLPV